LAIDKKTLCERLFAQPEIKRIQNRKSRIGSIIALLIVLFTCKGRIIRNCIASFAPFISDAALSINHMVFKKNFKLIKICNEIEIRKEFYER